MLMGLIVPLNMGQQCNYLLLSRLIDDYLSDAYSEYLMPRLRQRIKYVHSCVESETWHGNYNIQGTLKEALLASLDVALTLS
jgi:hypothetical protein